MSIRVALAVAALLLAASSAAAATDPALDARVRDMLDQARGGETADSALVTGRGDLILLSRRKLFVAHFTISPQRTSNAELAGEGGHADTLLTIEAGLGASTRVADRVNLHADISVLGVRYGEISALDYDAVTADIGADTDWATPVGRLSVGADYLPAVIYTRGFGDRQLTQHRLLAAAQLATPIRPRLSIISTGTVERTWADPQDYDNWGAAIDETLVFRPAPELQVAVGGGLYARRYPNYFPALIGVTRRDHGWRASVAVSYSTTPRLVLTASASHVENRSTSDVNPYRVDNGGLTARVALRF
jgi:hypothetical protein